MPMAIDTHRTDPAASRGDRHEAGDRARSCTEHRRRAAVDPFSERPGERCGGGGKDRVGEHHAGEAVGFEARAHVEAEPANPQQRGADHHHGHVVRRHGCRAVADALADHQGADQAGDAGVDVNDRATGEVECAFLEQEACGFGRRRACGRVRVRVRAGPPPDHVRHRQVREREPERHEQQHRAELDALGERADDQGRA